MSSREEFQKYTQEINPYASLSDKPLNYLQVINPWSIPKWQSLEVSIKLKHLNHPQVVMNPWSIAKWHLRSIQRYIQTGLPLTSWSDGFFKYLQWRNLKYLQLGFFVNLTNPIDMILTLSLSKIYHFYKIIKHIYGNNTK